VSVFAGSHRGKNLVIGRVGWGRRSRAVKQEAEKRKCWDGDE